MSISERQLAAFAADHNSLGSPVSPRYLAGPGDPRHITHALRAAGWTIHSDPLHPALKMTSHDRTLRLDLNPAMSRYWWKFSNEFGPGHWYASFSTRTPVEVVAGLTDALIRPTPDEPAPAVTDILTARGWQHTVHESGTQTLLSPDGTSQAEQYVSPSMGATGWEFETAYSHGEYGPQGLKWRAHLDSNIPQHLLAAVTNAVIDPTPVLRGRYEHEGSPHVTVGEEFAIGDAQFHAHKARLAQARRHRPTPPKPAVPAPATRTAGASPSR